MYGVLYFMFGCYQWLDVNLISILIGYLMKAPLDTVTLSPIDDVEITIGPPPSCLWRAKVAIWNLIMMITGIKYCCNGSDISGCRVYEKLWWEWWGVSAISEYVVSVTGWAPSPNQVWYHFVSTCNICWRGVCTTLVPHVGPMWYISVQSIYTTH